MSNVICAHLHNEALLLPRRDEQIEWVGEDLTLIKVVDQRVGLPLLKGDGILLPSLPADGIGKFPYQCFG